MKKIVLYISSLGKGGAERVIINLADELVRENNEIIIITSFKDEEEYCVPENVRRINLDIKSSSFLKKNLEEVKKLKKILKEEKPDTLISFLPEPSFRALISTILLPIKVIVSVRNDPDKEFPNLVYRLFLRILYPQADKIVFQTKEASKKIRFGNKVIIPNQVSDQFLEKERKKPQDQKHVVTLGRLENQKNHLFLIKSFQRIMFSIPNDNLIIYGEGSLRSQLEEYIQKHNLQDRVFLPGKTSDVAEVLSSCKVFVLSSSYEGLPNSLLEAMAVGVPVISTDCPSGGPKELIKDEFNGLLVDMNSEIELSEKISQVINDKDQALYLSENAKKRAQDFETKKIIDLWKKII